MRAAHLLPVLAAALLLPLAPAFAETQLTIMSYNVWGGGGNEQKPIDETVAVIKAAGADIIGIQETRLEADPCTAFARAAALKVISAGIVGEKAPEADLVVTPWPSDHRATMAKIGF